MPEPTPHAPLTEPDLHTANPPERRPDTEDATLAQSGAALLRDKPSVAGYEILEELGRGGMGVVYKARHLSLNRLVALKMILAGEHAGPQELARFRVEAKAIAQLKHPNIVQIYEVEEQSGRPFFSLEYIEGGSLDQRFNGTPLPPRSAATMIESLARAVHAAHEHGIVHRDLKPANVLLARDGTAKITDFGLAKRLDGQYGLSGLGYHTLTGAVLGTPSYMAPEQAASKTQLIGTATDTYALGAIFYELLTGRPPFRAATSVETMMQVLGEEPVAPARLQPGVPRDLETICLKCLEKDPQRRYSSALALADDLRRFLNGEPIHARAVRLWERGIKWARRRPAPAALIGVIIVAVLTVVIGSVFFTARLAEERNNAQHERDNAQNERDYARDKEKEANDMRARAEQALEQSRVAQVGALLGSGKRALDAGDYVGGLLPCAEVLRLDPQQADLHRFRLGMILQQCPRLLQVWTHGHEVVSAEFSPDGRLIAVADADGLVRIDDCTGGPSVLLPHSKPVQHAVFSPDSRRVLTAGNDGTARVWDATTGKEILPPLRHQGIVHEAVFSADGRRILTASADGTARVWDAANGKEVTPQPLRPGGAVRQASFAADGRTVLTLGDERTVRLWDAASGKEITPPHPHADKVVLTAAFSPDGRWVVTGTSDGAADVWETATGKERANSRNTNTGAVSLVRFSPDGRRLALLNKEGPSQLWDMYVMAPPASLGDQFRDVAFSPDGHRLLVSGNNDDSVRLLDLITLRPLYVPLTHSSVVLRARFSPEGRRVLTVTQGGTVWLWDPTPALTPAAFPPGVNGNLYSATLSPDGRRLITLGGDALLHLWDTSTGQETLPPLSFDSTMYSATFSPDGRFFATAGGDRTGRVWDAATGKAVTPPLRHGDAVFQTLFSPDGRRVVTVSNDHTARLWDATTGQELTAPLRHGNSVNQAAFSPDGRLLATACADNYVRIWDVATGRRYWTLRHEQPPASLVFNAEGTRLVTASNERMARIWDTATGKEAALLKTTGLIAFAEFSPDGLQVVTAGTDGTVQLWDAASGKKLMPPLQHGSGLVYRATFSPDGRRLATAGQDSAARLWDVATGTEISCPFLHLGPVTYTAFSADGRRLLTVAGDAARLWDLVSDTRAVDDLTVLARTLTGQQFDARGRTTPLAPTEVQDLLQTLRAHCPDDFALSAPGLRAWRQRQLVECESNQDWSAALNQLDRLLVETPDDADLRGRRLHAEARQQATLGASYRIPDDGMRALEAYTRSLELEPHDVSTRQKRASIYVALGYDRLDWKAWQPSLSVGYGFQAAVGYVYLQRALADYRAAGEQAPEDGSSDLAAFVLGAQLGQTDEPAQAWTRALERSRMLLDPQRLWEERTLGVPVTAQATWQAVIADMRLWAIVFPVNAPAWRTVALADATVGNPSGVVQDVPFVTDNKPDDWQAWWLLGRAHLDLSQPDLAVAALSKAIQLKGDIWDLWYMRGLAYTLSGQFDKAVADFDRAIALRPAGFAAWAARADAQAQRGRWDRVLEDSTEALKLKPRDFTVRRLRGRALQEKGDWAGAEKEYAALTTERPEDSEAWSLLGWARHMLRQDEQALAAYDAALDLRVDLWPYWRGRGVCHAQLKHFDQATADFARAADLVDSEMDVWLGQTQLLLAQDKLDSYRESCMRLLKRYGQTRDPVTAAALAGLCVVIPESGFEQAEPLRLAELAVDSQRDNSRYRLLRAALLYRTGRAKESIESLREAVKLSGKEATAWELLFLAMAEKRLGQTEAADRALQDAGRWLEKTPALPWEERLALQWLRREAEELLRK